MSISQIGCDGEAIMNPLQSSTKPTLEVLNIGKEYRLYSKTTDRIRALMTGEKLHRSYWALKDVNFKLYAGQCLGVVGNNGAGKSTLLKILARTLYPTVGSAMTKGRLTAILELGSGFHPEFTGRQNLQFGASLSGLSTQQIKDLEQEIIRFAEVEHAIDRPVKTYSSGMVMRLAFSLVTAVQPDIVIIDEALAVGDQNFQKKCVERIETFRRNGCTILFCSHSLYHVRQLCDVALWLDKGSVRAFGETERVLAAYEASLRQAELGETQIVGTEKTPKVKAFCSTSDKTSASKIISVQVAHLDHSHPPQLLSNDLRVTVCAEAPGPDAPSVGIMLEQAHGVGITSIASHVEQVWPKWSDPANAWEITLTFPNLPLHTGEYVISAYLFDHHGLVVCDEWKSCHNFLFVYPTLTPGLVRLPHVWS